MIPQTQRAKPEPASGSWLTELDFLWVEVTRKCNLKCVHCYAESGPELPLAEGMSYERWLDVLRQAFALGCRKVQFIGGEPSLCPELPELIGEARKIGFDFIEVYTNGNVLSRRLRDSLRKEKVALAFSVYGSRPETHDAITARPGSFVKTVKSIQWALETGLRVRVSMIVMPANSADVGATMAFFKALGVESVEIDRVRGVGRGAALVSAKSLDPMDELCGDCWKGTLTIDSNGNAFPCVFARSCPVGNVSESLATILQKEQLHGFRRTVRDKNQADLVEAQACKPRVQQACKPKVKQACKPKRQATPAGTDLAGFTEMVETCKPRNLGTSCKPRGESAGTVFAGMEGTCKPRS